MNSPFEVVRNTAPASTTGFQTAQPVNAMYCLRNSTRVNMIWYRTKTETVERFQKQKQKR